MVFVLSRPLRPSSMTLLVCYSEDCKKYKMVGVFPLNGFSHTAIS